MSIVDESSTKILGTVLLFTQILKLVKDMLNLEMIINKDRLEKNIKKLNKRM